MVCNWCSNTMAKMVTRMRSHLDNCQPYQKELQQRKRRASMESISPRLPNNRPSHSLVSPEPITMKQVSLQLNGYIKMAIHLRSSNRLGQKNTSPNSILRISLLRSISSPKPSLIERTTKLRKRWILLLKRRNSLVSRLTKQRM